MSKTKTITLILTQRCNLNCVYCYEHFKTRNAMSFGIARSSVEKHILNSNSDEVVIDFFGGEPFLEFDLMKQIYEYVESRDWNKHYYFSISTNGTLVHSEIQSWLMSRRHKCHVTLSLDGTKQMHDHNRSNSYSKIDFEFFKNCYPDEPVKMTLSQETLPFLSEGVRHIHSLGFKIANNLAYGIDWSNTDNIVVFQRELKSLIEYYLEHPDIEPCRLLSMRIEGVMSEKDRTRKWCGTGTDMVSIDVDGEEYPCQTFLPFSIGSEKAKLAQELCFTKDLVEKNCEDCILLPICPTCYGCNFDRYGFINVRDKSLCNFTKVRALACSYFEAKKLKRDNIKDRRITKLLIEAILKIQNGVSLPSY